MQEDLNSTPGGPKVCPQCETQYAGDIKFCPLDGWALRAAAADSDLSGEVIDDKYLIVRKLGEGGMGQVYLADHVQLPKQYAIKVMNPHLLHDVGAAARFGREAKNTSRIAHPNVAAVHDYGETTHGITYLVMEYVDGEPLTQLLRRESPLAPPRAVHIARQLAEALAAAHELDIVHRDLKPENVMVTRAHGRRDVVKLVDFGIARVIADEQRLTRTGLVVGTPAYMSPEQINGGPLDARSDLYSLGCILHEMLTGEPPFSGPSGEAARQRRLTDEPPRPRDANAYVPKALDNVVVKALARSPDDRFQSADEFAAALAAAPEDAARTSRWPAVWSHFRDAVGKLLAPPKPAPVPQFPAEPLLVPPDIYPNSDTITPPPIPSEPTHPMPIVTMVPDSVGAESGSVEAVATEPPAEAPPPTSPDAAEPEPRAPATTGEVTAEAPASEPTWADPGLNGATAETPTESLPAIPAFHSANGGSTPPNGQPSRRVLLARNKLWWGSGVGIAAVLLTVALWPRGITPPPPPPDRPDSLIVDTVAGGTSLTGNKSSVDSAQQRIVATLLDSIGLLHDQATAAKRQASQSKASPQELKAGNVFLRLADSLRSVDSPRATDSLAAQERELALDKLPRVVAAYEDAASAYRNARKAALDRIRDSTKRLVNPSAAVQQIVRAFVNAANGRRMADMLRLYPSMSSDAQGGWQYQFTDPNWSATMTEEGTPSINGESAEITFSYRTGSSQPTQPGGSSVYRFKATLHRDADSWHIQSLKRLSQSVP